MMNSFHIVLVGCVSRKLSMMTAHAQKLTGCRISHIVTLPRDVETLVAHGVPRSEIHQIDRFLTIPPTTRADLAELAGLECEGIQTIHNMILSDTVVSKLPYEDALAYACHLARQFRRMYRDLRPSVVLGGHDRMHSAMGAAIAKEQGVTWYALNFSVLPIGHIALSEGIVPDRMIELRDSSPADFLPLAASVLDEFQTGRLKAPAYVSAHSIWIVLARLGLHLRNGVQTAWRMLFGDFDRYYDFPLSSMIGRYLRKRRNMLFLPKSWFLTTAPTEPFLFFGLHMQPESTPDVVAAMVSNQLAVIEQVVRATPPTHLFLVKIHISDADNYSRAQLRAILRFPCVRLVAPTVSSRDFLDRADVVVTIAGTMGMEASLLGKPVILFGKMNYDLFPSIRRAGDPFDLPQLVRDQIAATPPTRDEILSALAKYLNTYVQATATGSTVRVDDWEVDEASASECEGFADLVRLLEWHSMRTPDLNPAVP